MRRTQVKSWLGAAMLALSSTVVVGSALAQTNREAAPAPKAQKPWFQWLAGTAFIIGVLIPAFKNPKRGHM